MVGRTSSERNGYSTQKPLKLMDRIRDLYTDEDDLIADFFMGSGSMIESAVNGNRNYIGCDINDKAVKITKDRLWWIKYFNLGEEVILLEVNKLENEVYFKEYFGL